MSSLLIRQFRGKLAYYLRDLDALAALLCFALCFALYAAVLALARKGRPGLRAMAPGLLVSLYVTAVLAITLFGRAAGTISVQPDFRDMFPKLPDRRSDLYYDALFNVLLFIPLGYLLSYKLKPVWSGLIVLFCTAAIELIQRRTGRGLFSGWDILLNSAGGMAGVGLFYLVRGFRSTYKKQRAEAIKNGSFRPPLLRRLRRSEKSDDRMNDEERVLLELLKSALFGAEPQIPEDTDWGKVMEEAAGQAVLGLAAQAVPPEQYPKWKREERIVVANAAQKAYAEQEMLQRFAAAGIPVAVIKGRAAAVYYPKPSRRWMGDIDLIVPQECFDEAKALMLASGCVLRDPERETTERELVMFRDGIEYELHYRFSDPDCDIESYIVDGLRHVDNATVDGGTFPMLPKLANGLVLLAHMRHHLQQSMGLRQLLDWMLYVDRELDDGYWRECFSAAAKETGTETLAITATRLCQKYLGLGDGITWCKDADEALCDALLELLLSSGNFGAKQGEGRRVERIATTMRKEGFFRYLQRAGENNWKAYHRHRWLKPFCWLYQTFRYLRQRMGLGRKDSQLLDDMQRSKERYRLLRRLHID